MSDKRRLRFAALPVFLATGLILGFSWGWMIGFLFIWSQTSIIPPIAGLIGAVAGVALYLVFWLMEFKAPPP